MRGEHHRAAWARELRSARPRSHPGAAVALWHHPAHLPAAAGAHPGRRRLQQPAGVRADQPRGGAHGGDLPRYRGNACQAWAIINGEEKVGLCIHKMIGGELDSGDIISKVYYPININTRVGEIYQWMEKEIPKLMLKSINKLSNPSFKAEKQSTKSEDIFRTYPRNPDDGKIDWKQDANKILRLINASSEPFSGAFSLYNNEKIIIWRAKLLIDKENYSAIPGQISKINKNTGSIEVITGNGKIKIIEIEFKNQRGKPSKFINSIRKRFK